MRGRSWPSFPPYFRYALVGPTVRDQISIPQSLVSRFDTASAREIDLEFEILITAENLKKFWHYFWGRLRGKMNQLEKLIFCIELWHLYAIERLPKLIPMIVPRFVFRYHSVTRICALKIVRGKYWILERVFST